MCALLDVVFLIIKIYWTLIIAAAIFSWLMAFGILDTRNQFVAMVSRFLYQITEPALRPIRGILPDLGGIDISPIILLILLYFTEIALLRYVYLPFGCAIY